MRAQRVALRLLLRFAPLREALEPLLVLHPKGHHRPWLGRRRQRLELRAVHLQILLVLLQLCRLLLLERVKRLLVHRNVLVGTVADGRADLVAQPADLRPVGRAERRALHPVAAALLLRQLLPVREDRRREHHLRPRLCLVDERMQLALVAHVAHARCALLAHGRLAQRLRPLGHAASQQQVRLCLRCLQHDSMLQVLPPQRALAPAPHAVLLRSMRGLLADALIPLALECGRRLRRRALLDGLQLLHAVLGTAALYLPLELPMAGAAEDEVRRVARPGE
mmetsp:Transcript_24681/g.57475  ORF Transcript_24681/g.57475 Transcript_24681/m.57475 type:complete len:280 (-) Transcript_24681:106-945(-)